MNFFENIINLLNKVYQLDEYIKSFTLAATNFFDTLVEKFEIIKGNLFFDTLNIDGVEFYETLLKITPSNTQTLNDRQASIQAKWLSNNHNSIDLIQKICNAWKNGEVEADFVNGKIKLKFVGQFGVPTDLDSLLKAVGEIKPAHLDIYKEFRYLLIKDIHEIKTIAEMELITLDKFASGRE